MAVHHAPKAHHIGIDYYGGSDPRNKIQVITDLSKKLSMNKRATKLLIFYARYQEGERIDNGLLQQETGISDKHLPEVKRELEGLGLCYFDPEHSVNINWKRIYLFEHYLEEDLTAAKWTDVYVPPFEVEKAPTIAGILKKKHLSAYPERIDAFKAIRNLKESQVEQLVNLYAVLEDTVVNTKKPDDLPPLLLTHLEEDEDGNMMLVTGEEDVVFNRNDPAYWKKLYTSYEEDE